MKADTDILYARKVKAGNDKHRREGYPDHARVVFNGRALSHSNSGLGKEWALRMERYFFEHLRRALLHPEGFTFAGYNGIENAQEWLGWHLERLGIDSFQGKFQLMDRDKQVESFVNFKY